ncbi:MAG: ABC transporter permease [Thermoanaerobaculia bacterium]
MSRLSERSPFLLCARRELRLAVRSRWTQAFAAVFGALSLAVAASGYVLSGGAGMQDFARTAASLMQLVLLIVPLTALVIGVLALSPERGEAELLFSQPVSRPAVLYGQLAGLFAALAGAEAIGLGAAGLVIFGRSGPLGAGAYGLLFASALLLTAIFLGIAALLAAGGPGRRARALALALIVWFAAVVLWDVAALALATLLPSGPASRVLIVAALANPIDAVRTGTLLAIEGTTAFGAASLALLRFTKGPAGAATLVALSTLAWATLPAALAARRLSRADL